MRVPPFTLSAIFALGPMLFSVGCGSSLLSPSAPVGQHVPDKPSDVIPKFEPSLAGTLDSISGLQSETMTATANTTKAPVRRMLRRRILASCPAGEVMCGNSCVCCGEQEDKASANGTIEQACDLVTLCSATRKDGLRALLMCGTKTDGSSARLPPAGRGLPTTGCRHRW